MKKRLTCILLSLCMSLTLLPAVAIAGNSGSVPEGLDHTTQAEWDVLRYTNIERAKEGLPLLVTFDRMQKMAGVRSDELLIQFSHTRPDGTLPTTVFKEYGFSLGGSAAENIAQGQKSAKEVVKDWMNSSGHRANILNEELRYMGTGHTKSYWVQLFAGSKIECETLTYYDEDSYFKLKLKNGIIAYAPYDPISSPTVNGVVTFNYPGADSASQASSAPELSILAYPAKTNYMVGEGFDTNGLKAVLTADGKEMDVNDKITFYTSKTAELTPGRPFATKGTKVIEMRYNDEKIAEYTITVTADSATLQPPVPVEFPTSLTADPTSSTVFVNGEAKEFEAYNIQGSNYFKLRDLAMVLSGSQKQFEVVYDSATMAITLTSGKHYTAFGGEMLRGDGSSKTATLTESRIYLNGRKLNLTVFLINGNNFFKLRDLMKALDVYVGYDNATNAITLDAGRSYAD